MPRLPSFRKGGCRNVLEELCTCKASWWQVVEPGAEGISRLLHPLLGEFFLNQLPLVWGELPLLRIRGLSPCSVSRRCMWTGTPLRLILCARASPASRALNTAYQLFLLPLHPLGRGTVLLLGVLLFQGHPAAGVVQRRLLLQSVAIHQRHPLARVVQRRLLTK